MVEITDTTVTHISYHGVLFGNRKISVCASNEALAIKELEQKIALCTPNNRNLWTIEKQTLVTELHTRTPISNTYEELLYLKEQDSPWFDEMKEEETKTSNA